MFAYQREKLINILDTAKKLQEKLMLIELLEDRVAVLTNCQQAAISVGEVIENDKDCDEAIVHLIEEYCEMIFQLSQMDRISNSNIEEVRVQLDVIKREISNIPLKYRVVFLPYKADMWDSLESIWRACTNDLRCECDVVPIPFFEMNREEKRWEPCYDGARFPADVPIVHYDYYRMDEMKPDIAYIHNPYDGYNRVTTVHPYYYSDELKKNVRKLVYVPYYANAGFVARAQQMMPVCRNMDYMIAQSESAKESCANTYFYNKILPFGSPKFDKVINKMKNGTDIPKEWQQIIGDKKVLMLNTTLNDLLNYGEILLNKLKYFFKVVKDEQRVVLIWRPHPLLEATIKSMRPHLMERYTQLVQYFNDNQVGILDYSGDVSNTVAVADGYVGSDYSSVVNLFGVCGKPIFLFNNFYYEEIDSENSRDIIFQSMICVKDKIYGIPVDQNGLFQINNGDIKLVCQFDGEPEFSTPFSDLAEKDGFVYLASNNASHAVVVNSFTMEFDRMSDVGREMEVSFAKVVRVGDKLFYLPCNEMLMMEYDISSNKWNYYTDSLSELWNGSEFSDGMWRTWSGTSYNNTLYITTGFTNRVLSFDVNSGRYNVIVIGGEDRGYSEIVADEYGLWIVDGKRGELVRWLYGNKDIQVFTTPYGYECWKNHIGLYKACSRIVDMGQYLVTLPGYANYMLKFNKETGTSEIFAEKFFQNASVVVNGYNSKYFSTGAAAALIDERHILVQRRCDGMMARINIDGEIIEEFASRVTEADYNKLTTGRTGFEKNGKFNYFCRRESRIFTIQGFIDDVAEDRLLGVKDKQLDALATLATNLDGTCGEKVHDYMMKELSKEG